MLRKTRSQPIKNGGVRYTNKPSVGKCANGRYWPLGDNKHCYVGGRNLDLLFDVTYMDCSILDCYLYLGQIGGTRLLASFRYVKHYDSFDLFPTIVTIKLM